MNKYALAVVFAPLFALAACGDTAKKSTANAPLTTPQSQSAPVTPVSASSNDARSPAERGEQIYKRCKSCHTVDEGGRNRSGPNLWDVVGRKAGSVEGFAYSRAMEESEIIWTEDNLSAYLLKPAEFLPGGRMAFAGIRDAGDRDDVIAYLKSHSSAAQ